MMSCEKAQEFASRWLPAWTGNDPERLASYYSDNCLYIDGSVPNGVKGKDQLIRHFSKLLGDNPEWVWTQLEAIPMEGVFLNKWLARIPVGSDTLEVVGVCLVQFDEDGKISRNEVYFDRSRLVEAIRAHNLRK